MTQSEQMQRLHDMTRAAFEACAKAPPPIALIDNHEGDQPAVSIDGQFFIYPTSQPTPQWHGMIYKPMWGLADEVEQLAVAPDEWHIVIEAVARWASSLAESAMLARQIQHERDEDRQDAIDFIHGLNVLGSPEAATSMPLPQFRKGEYINITGEVPSEDFIRRQRDGEEL